MPCILKVKVLAARDLPVMDRKSELTDAYVEIRYAEFESQRTDIARKTLSPVWNEDFRYEVSDDSDLQDEPLELRVLDYDAITANDEIGVVMLDLNPLLSKELAGQLAGWFPIYDTLRGMRGELHIQVRLQFFGDANPFKDSSAGVTFLSGAQLPPLGRTSATALGFVDAYESERDPEYHWSDNFRTPRASNEARQRLLYRLSGRLRRTLGVKVLDLGGNAVTGYRHWFDIEQEEGVITARAIGCAIRLGLETSGGGGGGGGGYDGSGSNHCDNGSSSVSVPISLEHRPSHHRALSAAAALPVVTSTNHDINHHSHHRPSVSAKQPIVYHSPSTSPTNSICSTKSNSANNSHCDISNYSNHREGDHLASSLRNSNLFVTYPMPTSPSGPVRPRLHHRRANSIMSDHHSLAPYAFRTTDQELFAIDTFPSGAIIRLGGLVTARSVKLIDSGNVTIRETWWNELREEIREHARALGCHNVIGYMETTAIHDDLCVLSVTGTAAIIELGYSRTTTTVGAAAAATSIPTPLSHSFTGANPTNATTNNNSNSNSNSNSNNPGIAPMRRPSYEPASNLMMSSSSTSQDKVPWMSRSMPRYTSRRIRRPSGCRMLHLPYHRSESPFTMNYVKCGCCRKRFVPEILLTSIERPPELDLVGEGCFVQAQLCRAKKRKEGESNAAIISEAIPFIEYDIHRQLVYKLRIQGMNAIFGIRIQLAIGDSLIVATATGMAYYLTALPTPPALRIARNLEVLDEEDRHLLELQRRIMTLSERNRDTLDNAFQIKKQQQQQQQQSNNTATKAIPISIRDTQQQQQRQASSLTSPVFDSSNNINLNNNVESDSSSSSSSDSEDELDAEARRRHAVVHIDDDTDEDLLSVLLDPVFGDDFRLSCELARAPAHQPHQMVQLVHVVKQSAITSMDHHPNRQFSNIIRQLYEELRTRLQTLEPCLLGGIQLIVQLPRAYEVQVQLIASVLQPIAPIEFHSKLARVSIKDNNRVALARRQQRQRQRQQSYSLQVNRDADGHVIWPTSHAKAVDPWSLLPDDAQCAADELANITGPIMNQRTLSEPVKGGAISDQLKRKTSSNSRADTASTNLFTMDEDTTTTTTDLTQALLPNATLYHASTPTLQTPQPSASASMSVSPAPSMTHHSEVTTTTTCSPKWAKPPRSILLTPLRSLPISRVEHLGRFALHFVKESHAGYDIATLGIGSFTRLFLAEVHASVKAYAAALGGDAVVAFNVDASQLLEDNRGHTYALACISGDVVRVIPDEEDDDTSSSSSSNSSDSDADSSDDIVDPTADHLLETL